MGVRPMYSVGNESYDDLVEGVLEAVNKLTDPAAKAAVVASLKEHVPQVCWFTNSRGVVYAG